jgi:hypothetical protein
MLHIIKVKSNLIFVLLKNMAILSAIAIFSCSTPKNINNLISKNYIKNPPLIIYKTKKNYFHNVPFNLTDDKKSIGNYPHPVDVFYKSKLAYPTELANGYFIDNRGISIYSAFSSYDYETYSKLKVAPSELDIMQKIIDFDPFVEMYHCGCRHDYKDEVATMNELIRKGQLKNCKVLISK